LPCETGDGQTCDYRMFFTNSLVQNGKNKGKPMFELNAEFCIELGMMAPFDPSRIEELHDKLAHLVMVEETYNGKQVIRAKYLNPVRKAKLQTADIKNIWAKLKGKPAPAADADPDAVPFD